MPGVRPDQQPARHMHALQRGPVLESIANGHAEVLLADAQQHRRLPVRRIGDWTLLAPDGAAHPRWSVVGHFASVDRITLSPLSCQINLTGMTDDALVTCGGG